MRGRLMDKNIGRAIYWLYHKRPNDAFPEVSFSQAGKNGDRLRAEILHLIEKDDSLRGLLSGCQVIGASRNPVTSERLAAWAVSCIHNYTPFEEWLVSYLSRNSFSAYAIALLTGVEIDQAISLGNYGSLMSIYSLPNKTLQVALGESLDANALTPQYSAALVIPFQHPLMIGQAREGELHPIVGAKLELLDDVLSCLALAGGGSLAVHKVATSIVAADDVPCFGPALWEYHSFRVMPKVTVMVEDECTNAVVFLDKLYAMDEAHRNRVRLPLSKLNDFHACKDLSEAAVLLRTCLESIFLDNDSGELSHRLSIRAALVMGGSIEERLATYRMMKKAYEHGSAAVHRGKISSKRPQEVVAVLQQAAKVAKKVISLHLDSPGEDWLTLELGGAHPHLM